MILTCRLHRINRHNSRHGVSRQPRATIITPLSTAALRHRDRFSGHAKPQLPQCAKPMRNGYLSALRKAVTALHKYAENGMRKWINIQHNSKIRAFFRPTAPSVANTRVLKGFVICLTDSSLRIMAIWRRTYGFAKEPISGCDIGSFRPRYGAFRVLIWCISQAERAYIARPPFFCDVLMKKEPVRKRLFNALRQGSFRAAFFYFAKNFCQNILPSRAYKYTVPRRKGLYRNNVLRWS